MTAFVRLRTVQRAVRSNACSCWCSRSACAGRPGGTSALLISGCPTEKLDAATATAACPVRDPWTWTLTIQCGSQMSRLTWNLSSSWPEPSETQREGVWFGDVQSIGIYLQMYFEGADWQEVTQNCVKGVLCKEKIKVVLVTGGVSHEKKEKKKRLPADFNPVLSFTVDLVKSSNKSNTQLSFDAWIWTGNNRTWQCTRLLTLWLQRLYVNSMGGGGIFRFCFLRFFFYYYYYFQRALWTAIKCFLITRMAGLPNMDYSSGHSYWSQTNRSLVFTCYGMIKLFFSSWNILYFLNGKNM